MALYYLSYGQLVYKCGRCGMMLATSTHVTLNEKFCLLEPEELTPFLKEMKREDESRLCVISSYLNRNIFGSKVLDVGCGLGTMLDACEAAGAEYCGIEPDRQIYERLLSLNQKAHGRVFNGTLDSFEGFGDGFDIVLLIHVLEHVPDPVKFLQSCRKYLRKGGIIYIEVPNESMLKTKIFLKKIAGVYFGTPTSLEHNCLFIPETLEKVIFSSGYSMVKLKQRSILSNLHYVRMGMGGEKLPWMMRAIVLFLKVTYLDLLLRQGMLVVVAELKSH